MINSKFFYEEKVEINAKEFAEAGQEEEIVFVTTEKKSFLLENKIDGVNEFISAEMVIDNQHTAETKQKERSA